MLDQVTDRLLAFTSETLCIHLYIIYIYLCPVCVLRVSITYMYIYIYICILYIYRVHLHRLFPFDCSPSRAVKVVPISLIPCKYANAFGEARSNRRRGKVGRVYIILSVKTAVLHGFCVCFSLCHFPSSVPYRDNDNDNDKTYLRVK